MSLVIGFWRSLVSGGNGVFANALTLNDEALTLNGEYITLRG